MTYTNESYKTRIARIYTSADENVINVVGGGFLIFDQYIVTCAHVVADALKIDHITQDKPLGLIKLDFPFLVEENKPKFEANIILWKPRSNSDYSYGEDIAVLELSKKLPTTNVTFQLSLADTTNHQFSVLGFPKGRDQGVITKGKLLGTVGSGLVQIEVPNQSSFYIEPGFSGAPVWDEELVSFVGIVVSSELCKYSNNTVRKPADELRKDIKIAYMIPAKVLVETWSFLSLIQVLTANLDTATIQTAYKYYGNAHGLVNSHQTTVEGIIKDLYDLDKRNLDSNIKFNRNHHTTKFIKYLITNNHIHQIHQTKLEDLKKWGRNNIEDFDKLIQDVNQQYQNTDTKLESYILIKIKPLNKENEEFSINAWVIPNIQNNEHCRKIDVSDCPDDSFTLKKIEENLFSSLLEKMPCELGIQKKFVFFLPPEYLHHPVEKWKINITGLKHRKEECFVGEKYPVIVRDVDRLEKQYKNVHKSNWIDKWQRLENITCNNFQKLHEYDEKRFSLLMNQAIGVILNIFDENNKNDTEKITKIFNSLKSNAVPIAICHRDKITLEQEEYERRVDNELQCCIHTLPNHVMKQYVDFFLHGNKYLFANNVFLIYENPHILPPDTDHY
jgi:hypothetical protein